MELVNFSKDDKEKMFTEIAELFFNKNFGQLSKSDMELLMFRFYLEKLVSNSIKKDGTIDYNKCSDYKISKELGITQQRVRNLKVKCQLKYPMEYNWQKALASLTSNARYDQKTHKITLNIPDPNLYLEIQNFIEEHGAYVEKQLNSKVLQLRIEYYIDLILSFEDGDSRKKIIKKLKEHFKSASKNETSFDESNIGKSLIDGVVNITTIAASITGLISPQNVVGSALIGLLQR